MNKKREINVWDVFWLQQWGRQRKVLQIKGDWSIVYHDWIWIWTCSRSHFMKRCPREVEISKRCIEIAKKIAEWRYEIYSDAKNEILMD